MDTIEVRAFGKLNLSLDITGKRADGYHLVRMVMQTVAIYDTIVIRRNRRTAETGSDILIRTGSTDLPAGPDNLIWKAADTLKRACGIHDSLTVDLIKRIPVAAGMAGGSSDAAAVLRGLREMYGLDLSDETLRRLALPLGADIPYCIGGGTQLAEGIGEVLTVLPQPPECTVLVVKPDLYVSTGEVYQAYDAIPEQDVKHPDVDAQVRAIRTGSLYEMAAACGNVLEQQTGTSYPVIGELERFFTERDALCSIMTGSGPTVFALYDDAQKADAAMQDLRQSGKYRKLQMFETVFCSGK